MEGMNEGLSRKDALSPADRAVPGSLLKTAKLAERGLTEEELRQRQLPFAEASAEEKVRRLHVELIDVRNLVLNQMQTIARLQRHQHGASGEMVLPYRQDYAAEGCAARRDPLA